MDTAAPELDVTKIFEGKNILLIGTTGFVGKVALSMLLHRYPGVKRVYCLVRPGAGNTAKISDGSDMSVGAFQPPSLLNSQILGGPTLSVDISRPSGKKARANTIEW